MQFMKKIVLSLAMVSAGWLCATAQAAGPADVQQASWVAKPFRFHDGQQLPELRLHYRTLGNPAGEPVLILHGSGGSGAAMLGADFAGQLFGPGQPLDTAKHFIILPDAIGTGQSSKPSDGLGPRFPKYNYEDMVQAQYRLVTEGLGIKHLRLVLGFSMGGMHTWLWGVRYPEFMDALVPMASQPTQMSGRNWMTRRLMIDMVRNDPDWNGGDYKTQPRSLKIASAFFNLTTNGGTEAFYKAAPTRADADKLLQSRLAAPFTTDANDFVLQWESSWDYNPAPELERIKAPLLAINSADDERNPPELGVMERELKRIPGASLYLVPGSADTRGHGTVMLATLWKQPLQELLQRAPRKTAP
jgi:homoserine O-acetyltransferase/O-succinyltransferase